MMMKWCVFLSVAAFGVAVLAQPSQAQEAGAKAKGHDYNFWDTMGWQQHAQSRARSAYYYGQTPQPAPEKVTEHATATRTGVTSAQKSLAELKKANPENKEAQASIAKIEAIQKKLIGHCEMADKAIAKGDHAEMASCYADMFHDLEAANAEMQKLQKLLKISNPELPKR